MHLYTMPLPSSQEVFMSVRIAVPASLRALPALLLAGLVAQSSEAAAPTAPVPASGHAVPSEMRPLTIDDVVRLKRLSEPRVSPDGRYVAYVLRETDMEANKGRTDVWLLDLTQNAAGTQ